LQQRADDIPFFVGCMYLALDAIQSGEAGLIAAGHVPAAPHSRLGKCSGRNDQRCNSSNQ
jgi:hypothetical protein